MISIPRWAFLLLVGAQLYVLVDIGSVVVKIVQVTRARNRVRRAMQTALSKLSEDERKSRSVILETLNNIDHRIL
jgi:hypothetical protein